MGDGKGTDFHAADGKWLVCPNLMEQPVWHLSQGITAADAFQRTLRPIDGNLIFPAEHSESLNVVYMLMGNQDAVQFPCGYPKLIQPLFHTLPADSRVNH